MRISDWSSDVCSSDLRHAQRLRRSERGLDVEQAESFRFARRPLDAARIGDPRAEHLVAAAEPDDQAAAPDMRLEVDVPEIGRASCRERVCQYVSFSVVAVSLKKKNNTNSTYES